MSIGPSLDDMRTLEECEEAIAYLEEVIVAIENQIANEDSKPHRLLKTSGLLRIKRCAGLLRQTSFERRLIDNFQTVAPSAFAIAMEITKSP